MPNHIQFSQEGFQQLKKLLLQLKSRNSQPCFAAFDADGTLWDSDIGENFFQYQIDHCNLKDLEGLDPWAHYAHLKSNDPRLAYLWLAQINRNVHIDQVRKWSQQACEKNPPNIFESQKQLIHWLSENDIIPIVVTASIRWAVEPAAQLLGIPKERVIGVQTKIDSEGLVTNTQEGPITWRQGKVEGAKLLSGGKNPILCAGNTSGDKDLLAFSSGVSLAIQTQKKINPLFKDEQTLLDIAIDQKWLTHSFC